MDFIHKVPLAPSKWIKVRVSALIKVDKWDYFQSVPQGFFSLLYFHSHLFSFNYETIIISSALSFDHSDPDPSSVSHFALKLRTQAILAA